MKREILKTFGCLTLTIVSLCSATKTFAQTQTAKDFFEQGLRLVAEQKLTDALAAFQKSAQLDQNQPAAFSNIGTTLLALNRPAEAIAPFRAAVRLAPNEAGFRIGLCQSLSITKAHAEAVVQCEEAVRLNPNAPNAHAALATALLEAKQSERAVTVAENALQKFAESEVLLNVAANAQTESGNFARAVEIYETLARLKPAAVFYQVRLAENYLRLERDAEAIVAAQKAIALEKHPLAYFFLGRVYFELGQNEEAADAFRQSAALDAKSANAFYFLGLSEQRRAKSESAIAALRQAVALAPEDFDYNKQLGSALTDAARYNEAVAPLKKAVALKPADFEAKVNLGLALFESAHYEEAMPFLLEADRMKPGNQIVTMFLSVARSRQQGVAQIEEMKRYAKEHPDDLNVRLGLLQFLGYAQRLPEAEPYIEEVLRTNPKDTRVYGLIGAVYSTNGKYDKALEVYQKSLAVEPNPGAYLGLASFYAKRGQIAEAMRAYEKVLKLKPDSPNIMKIYADLLRDNGKRREALIMYQRSLEILPTNAPALLNAGVLSAKLGDLNQARQLLETLKAVDGQSAKLLQRFLKLYK